MAKTCDFCVAAASALIFLPSLLLNCAAAQTVHVVGDTTGWTVPSDANFYATWASSKTFHLNDVLSFNFPTNVHDVVRVPKASFDACTSGNQIGATITAGPANVTLKETGTHYFICTVGQHCQGGQKLAVTVGSGSSPTPAGAPSSSTPQIPSPRPSSAPPPPSS
ncbi:cucumber peeling cupredoxin-like isoform X2 [Neltuma alba]|uniref:cucumber peeling cupredoxin isoform X2 n=1 Tax=Neltuma alba TaxID=207710 RepID=UPI0010A311C6|nr:cucumber peeling cupredoxin-like isoform X2 [Prosopis alba]XP_028791592.1 cucumber peeling cupredoxin-like isoform X2 [Prosopis alba]